MLQATELQGKGLHICRLALPDWLCQVEQWLQAYLTGCAGLDKLSSLMQAVVVVKSEVVSKPDDHPLAI